MAPENDDSSEHWRVLEARLDHITASLTDHLTRTAERERAVAAALESLTGQLNQFTGTLAAELRRSAQETISAALGELKAAGGAIGAAADRLTASLDALDESTAQLAASAATVASLPTPISASDLHHGLDLIAEHVSGLRSSIGSAGGLTRGDLDAALAELPAPLARADLDAAVQAIGQVLAEQPRPDADAIADAVADALGSFGAGPSAEEVAAALRGALAELPAPLARADLDAAVGAIGRVLAEQPRLTPDDLTDLADAVARLPAPPSADELAEAVRRALADLPAPLTAVELADAVATATAELQSPATAADLDAAVAAVGRLLAEQPRVTPDDITEAIATALDAVTPTAPGVRIDDLTAALDARPSPATTDDLAGVLHDALHDVLRDALAHLPVPEPASSLAPDVAAAMVEQLDALGRLVHHLVRSIHVVEAVTVGVSPNAQRARAEAAAAFDDPRAARARVAGQESAPAGP